MAMIFISHSSKDAEQAERMKRWLEGRGFQNIFLDFDKHSGLAPGADWERTLYQMLERSEAVVVIVTPRWLESKWCFAEFTQARALGKAIFPVIETPVGDQLIAPDIQHVDLLSDREGGLERLSKQLTRIVLDAQGGFEWDTRRPPYPGLTAFEEADAAIFFGRDDDIRHIIERLNARRAHGGRNMITILGGSGSGKSSILRAGVLPRLKRENQNWIVLPPFRPQTNPVQEFATVLAMALGTPERWREIFEQISSDRGSPPLEDIGRDLRIKFTAMDASILIPIDQGEELFTMASTEEANRFFDLMSRLLVGDSPYMALLTLRSDYLAQLQLNRMLTARIEEFSLKPMPLARIAEIIEGPARVAGIAIDKQLVIQAIQDATTSDALPLLAFTLRELYDRFGRDRRLTFADYSALGDLEYRERQDGRTGLNPFENSIRRKADEILRELAPSEAEIEALRDAFSPFLVRINDAGEYTRRTAAFSALPPASHRIIEALIKGRLLLSSDETEQRKIEVAHDALLRKWPLLKGWLDNEKDLIAGLQRIQPDLDEWQRAAPDKRTGLLLSGAKLELARLWMQSRPHKLDAREQEYIGASIDHADALKRIELQRLEREKAQVEQTRRFQKRLTAALAVLGSLIGLVACGSYFLAQLAAERESQLFASKAFDAFEAGRCDRALRYAVAGLPSKTGWGLSVWSQEARHELRKAALDCRLLTQFAEHTEDLSFASFSPDAARVLTTSRDKSARIWDRATGKALLLLDGHESAVMHGDFDPSQQLVSTASEDRTARLWDARTGSLRHVLRGHAATVWTAYFDRQGARLLTSSDDGTAKLWRADSGQLLHTLASKGPVAFAIFNGTSTIIATGGSDTLVRLWNAESGEQIAEMPGHAAAVRAAAFSSDDKVLVTTSDDGTVRFWDGRTGAPRLAREGSGRVHSNKVLKVAVDPYAPRAATGAIDGIAVVWNLDTGEKLVELRGHSGEVSDVAFLGGNRVATVSRDHSLRIWDAESGQPIAVLNGHDAAIESVAVSAGGRMLLTAAHDKTARAWDATIGRATGHLGADLAASEALALDAAGKRAITGHDDGKAYVWSLDDPRAAGRPLAAPTGNVGAVALSRDGQVAATGSADGSVRLWSTGNGTNTHTLALHQQAVTSLVFSTDGRQLLSTSQDRIAAIWSVASGAIRHRLDAHGDEVSSGDISPDQFLAATASLDGKVRLWNMSSGALVTTLEGHKSKVWKVRFSPDSRKLLTVSDDATARLWAAREGRLLHVLKGHDQPLGSGAFSPDARLVVTSSDDNTARVWDVETGAQRFVLRGHASNTLAVGFSSDGKRILTTSRDGTARVWSAEDGGMLLVLRGHRASVGVAAFFDNDAALITASQDATVRLWSTSTGPLETAAETRAKVCNNLIPGARSFTSAEAGDAIVGGSARDRHPCNRSGSLGLTRLWH